MRTRLLLLHHLLLTSVIPVFGDEGLITFPEDRSFLPKSWITAPIDAAMEPLKKELHDEAAGIINTALAKYPAKIRARCLRGIHVVGGLRFYDVSYGGTYMANSRRIVLVYREGFEKRGFEQRFHHEFSSLLLEQNESLFEFERWTSANEPDFSYRAGGTMEEQNGDLSESTRVLQAEQKKTGGSGSSLLQLDIALMEDGFLTRYNMISIEEDLNEIAAHLFTNHELWEMCRRYPRIDQKVDVLIEFYRRLDKSMDRLFFRHLTASPQTKTAP